MLSCRLATSVLGARAAQSAGTHARARARVRTHTHTQGEAMIEAQRAVVEAADFLVTNNVELVVHSHLQRARHTFEGQWLCCLSNKKNSLFATRLVD